MSDPHEWEPLYHAVLKQVAAVIIKREFPEARCVESF